MDKFRKCSQYVPGILVDRHSTGHTFLRWRGATLEEDEVAPEHQPLEPASDSTDESDVEPLLDLSTIIITETWKGLPQELVDYIVFMLGNDLKSLKACSLTCKALFISTRHIIHQDIYLTSENNWELLTLKEKQRYIRGDRQGIAIRVLSEIAAHGLLPYARHLFIHLHRNFTPGNLQPFNDHFQRFDRVQELSIYWLDTSGFLRNFDTHFANFVPTLRSLHLDTPAGNARDILDFISRFPHLDDLSFKVSSEESHDWRTWKSGSFPVVERVAPFRGRLKLGRVDEWRGYLVQHLISLPGKRCFRFIDFRSCTSGAEQPVVDACSNTVETVSTTWKKFREC